MVTEDPLSDAVYKSPHQRRINYDIWQNNRLLLELAVEDHEEFEARLQALRDTIGVLRASPVGELDKWFETMEMRMVNIRTRACAILRRGGTAGRKRKSRPPTPRGSGEEEEEEGADSPSAAGEESDDLFEESEDEGSGDEEDTDEEPEEDGDDDDYH